MAKKKIKAIGYVRVSSISQKNEGQSLEVQEIELEKLFLRKGIARDEIIILNEGHASARSVEHRDMFREAVDLAIENDAEYFGVYDFSRFTRNVEESLSYFKLLHRYRIKLTSCSQEIDDTPEGFLMYVIQSGMNEYYSVKLSHDVKKAHKHLREKGIYPGKAPFGYENFRNENKQARIRLNEELGNLIAQAFKRYAYGELNSLNEVAEFFYMKGVTSASGKKFNKQAMSRMFNQSFYYGYFKNGEELVKHVYPSIIDKELFNKVQVKLTGKKVQSDVYKKENEDFPLRSVCYCEECVAKIYGAPSRGSGGVYKYYWCKKKDAIGLL